MQASFCRVVTIARVNATSSTFWLCAVPQQRPTFHAFPTPSGQIMMNPWLSATLLQFVEAFQLEPVPPSGW